MNDFFLMRTEPSRGIGLVIRFVGAFAGRGRAVLINKMQVLPGQGFSFAANSRAKKACAVRLWQESGRYARRSLAQRNRVAHCAVATLSAPLPTAVFLLTPLPTTQKNASFPMLLAAKSVARPSATSPFVILLLLE
jgi:hypothetical protein